MGTYLGIYFGIAISRFVAMSRGATLSLLVMWSIVLVIFVGTREWTGCDFGGYLNRFETYKATTLQDVWQSAEPGFVALNYLVIDLGLDYMWLNVLAATIFFVAIFTFASKREDGLALVALFFPVLVIQLGMSGIRQALAVAFLLLAWNAFAERKRIWTLLWILAASQFHTSAVVFLPMVLLIGRRVSALTMGVAVTLALPVLYYLLADRAEVYQTRYIEEDNESLGAVFRVALTTITSLAYEWYRQRYEELYPKDYPLMRAFSLFGFGTLVLYFVSTLAAHRMNYYVMPIQLLMLSRLPAVMSGGRKGSPLAIVPFLVYALYMIVWFGLSRHASACYNPYDSYLY